MLTIVRLQRSDEPNLTLDGQNTVTGASRESALRLWPWLNAAEVVVNYASSPDAADAVVKDIESKGAAMPFRPTWRWRCRRTDQNRARAQRSH